MVKDMDFYSENVRCSALRYETEWDTPKGVIVMAHGLGGVKELWIDKFAEYFCENGYHCFLFDYRNSGTSDGNKRQLVNVRDQLRDWANAIEFAKKEFKTDKVGLFGSSFSGGHVMKLLSERDDAVMAISQCPYTDTVATVKTFPFRSVLRFVLPVTLDLLSCLTGYHPYMLELTNETGKGALMRVPNYDEYLRRVPEGLVVDNRAPARTILQFLKYSPGKCLKKINKPIFIAPCLQDNLAPAYKTIELAGKCATAEVKEFDCNHFDIYFGEFFEEARVAYLEFLDRNCGLLR